MSPAENPESIPHWLETFKYLTGFGITLCALTVMWWITALIGRFFAEKK